MRSLAQGALGAARRRSDALRVTRRSGGGDRRHSRLVGRLLEIQAIVRAVA